MSVTSGSMITVAEIQGGWVVMIDGQPLKGSGHRTKEGAADCLVLVKTLIRHRPSTLRHKAALSRDRVFSMLCCELADHKELFS